VLLLVFAPMIWFVFSLEPDEVTIRIPRLRATPDTCLKVVLVAVNVMLIIAIMWSQQVGP
jgi:hypothetical protein